MSLTESQLRLLHAEDGFASERDLEQLAADGVDVDAALELRGQVRASLMPSAWPSLAPMVMARLGFPTMVLADALRSEASPAPELADAVMRQVGASEPSSGLLANAIGSEAGEPPALWAAVAAEIGVAENDLGALLRGAVEVESGDSQVHWIAARKSWWIAGAAAGAMMAAAAALLLWVGLGSEPVVPPIAAALPMDFEAPVEIESLEVGDDAVVQVLQFGENAPTIIFVDDDFEGVE